MARALVLACLLGALVPHIAAFYLPGVAPHDYEKVRYEFHIDPANARAMYVTHSGFEDKGLCIQDQPIKGLKVNKLSSAKTQLPYEFYSLPYCRPEKIESSAENLGEVLRGDRIVNSMYEVNILVIIGCDGSVAGHRVQT